MLAFSHEPLDSRQPRQETSSVSWKYQNFSHAWEVTRTVGLALLLLLFLKSSRGQRGLPQVELTREPSPSVIVAASGQKAGRELSEVPSNLKFSTTKAVLLKKELLPAVNISA